jgi:hypothetical protein
VLLLEPAPTLLASRAEALPLAALELQVPLPPPAEELPVGEALLLPTLGLLVPPPPLGSEAFSLELAVAVAVAVELAVAVVLAVVLGRLNPLFQAPWGPAGCGTLALPPLPAPGPASLSREGLPEEDVRTTPLNMSSSLKSSPSSWPRSS